MIKSIAVVFLCALGTALAAELPLHTSSHWIVDAKGKRVKLAGVNWYGADNTEFSVGGLAYRPLAAIAHLVKTMGFNSVRIPWSNELVETDPVVPDYAIAANPALKGKRALEVLDLTINAVAHEGLYVILDNHVSRADWCCYEGDGNALWHSPAYPEERWLADWRFMARRYKDQPAVIGADLRNELRFGATWGGNDPAFDWHAAAERGGNVILEENPNLLIFVEGIDAVLRETQQALAAGLQHARYPFARMYRGFWSDYALDLSGLARLPVRLNVSNRLVYSPHAYSFRVRRAQIMSDHSGTGAGANRASLSCMPSWRFFSPGIAASQTVENEDVGRNWPLAHAHIIPNGM